MPIQTWWLEKNGHWYNQLPQYHAGMTVRCPVKNRDGTEIAADDVRGCGSANVTWNPGDVYDCRDCGIFFSDYAADPPHRRPDDPEVDPMDQAEFHAKRRMFIVRGTTVLVAPPNYPYSHIEWLIHVLQGCGDVSQPQYWIQDSVRGYVLGKHIRVYQGDDFSHRVDHAAVIAAIEVLGPLVGGIDEIGFGARPGPEQPWEPRASYPVASFLARANRKEPVDVVPTPGGAS